jgi:hypothetical protein
MCKKQCQDCRYKDVRAGDIWVIRHPEVDYSIRVRVAVEPGEEVGLGEDTYQVYELEPRRGGNSPFSGQASLCRFRERLRPSMSEAEQLEVLQINEEQRIRSMS